MDRDLLLILTGGVIGMVSSLATIFLTYVLDGMRLRRQWEREDQLHVKQKRDEIEEMVAAARTNKEVEG